MKKSIVLSLFTIGLLASCTYQGTPGGKRAEAKAIAEGKVLFDNSCHKCHALPEPKDFTDEQWVGLVESMAPKAKLTKEQGDKVYQYVSSAN